ASCSAPIVAVVIARPEGAGTASFVTSSRSAPAGPRSTGPCPPETGSRETVPSDTAAPGPDGPGPAASGAVPPGIELLGSGPGRAGASVPRVDRSSTGERCD